MDTTELPPATLDCWVERAELLRMNPHASPSELASISHWPSYTLNLDLAAQIIKREGIAAEQIDSPYRGTVFFAWMPHPPRSDLNDEISFGDTYLDAAMLCYVERVFGIGIKGNLLWDDGSPRFEMPYE